MKSWLLALTPALVLSAIALDANAQDMKRQFPDGATPIPDATLKEKLSGKTFAQFSSDNVKWTYEYKDNGFFKLSSTSNVLQTGTWRAENGKLCTQPRAMAMVCGEARVAADVIYVRRENGEVVPLEAP